MTTYDIDFAAKLARVADEVDEKDPWAHDARRVTLYLARLSAEITLKALLEKAGMPVHEIRKRSHDLCRLLADIGDCQVQLEIPEGTKRWVDASRVRSVCIDLGFVQIPIGIIIDAEKQGASQYPNEIRYGNQIIDFKPSMVSQMALLLSDWAIEHWNSVRYKPKNFVLMKIAFC